ncbi:MAG TPA: GntR family transcriptional regulator [Ktedonobacterales bacterium]|jgi:DNA-binding FadR family transcriptional regulator|nr:GntR family transcriptional regulator [Ktedonobacterales bacterium]
MSRQDSAYLRICTAIEDDIRAGKLAKGHRLPGEHGLAQRFGVSRTTVRQALAELARRWMITTRAGSGSRRPAAGLAAVLVAGADTPGHARRVARAALRAN